MENEINDVPETSEELEEVLVNTGNDEELNQETVKTDEDIDKLIEERANKLMEEKIQGRLAKDRASRERKQAQEMAKYKQLESVLKAGLGVDNLDDAISKTSEFYKGQGITIPEYRDSRTDDEELYLAERDAKAIMELGKEEMEEEVKRLASIPYENRNIREKKVFDIIGNELKSLQQIEELKNKGLDTEILNNEEFKKFKNQFNSNTPISTVYEIYSKTIDKPEKPASAGSAKNDTSNTEETFSAERINKMSSKEMAKYWNNPAFRKIAGLK